MGDTEKQLLEYQTRLQELVKRDYIYLFIGLVVVGMGFGFLYTQYNPGKSVTINTIFQGEPAIDKRTLEETGSIAGIIEERQLNFVSPAQTQAQSGLTRPQDAAKLSRPEENGQISAIASGRVTSTATRYTVQEGDNLAYIAGLMYGDREAWVAIAEANDLISNPDAIYEGMVLIIPR